MKTWASQLYQFYTSLHPGAELPDTVCWLYPLQEPTVIAVLETFLYKYFDDCLPRLLILGINPGRFGAGVTGINFTAAKQLKEECGIDHSFNPHCS